jgi:hypothetical protein
MKLTLLQVCTYGMWAGMAMAGWSFTLVGTSSIRLTFAGCSLCSQMQASSAAASHASCVWFRRLPLTEYSIITKSGWGGMACRSRTSGEDLGQALLRMWR